MTHTVFINSIRPFQDKMYRLAKRLLISTDEAKDVTQEILLKMWQDKEKLLNINNLEAYAMTLTKNLCYDRLKLKNSDNQSLTYINYEAETHTSLQQQIESKDAFQQVQKAINKLPEQQRMVLQLRDIEQFEFEEIEKITGIKEATIRVILSRARKSLREMCIKK